MARRKHEIVVKPKAKRTALNMLHQIEALGIELLTDGASLTLEPSAISLNQKLLRDLNENETDIINILRVRLAMKAIAMLAYDFDENSLSVKESKAAADAKCKGMMHNLPSLVKSCNEDFKKYLSEVELTKHRQWRDNPWLKKNRELMSLTKDVDDKSIKKTHSHIRTVSVINAVYTIDQMDDEKLDFKTVGDNLLEQQKALRKGDVSVIEKILISQAQTLDVIFYQAARKIFSGDAQNAQIYGDLVIKANNSSRKTLLALHQIKNPPTIPAVQNNFAINQQINQGDPPLAIPDNKDSKKIVDNELLNLRSSHDEKMDRVRTAAPIKNNSKVEALDNRRRKDSGRKSR